MDPLRIVKSPFPPHSDRPAFDNFAATLSHALLKHRSATAIENVTSGEKVTFHEIKEKSETMGRHLWKIGCRKGDAIAIFSPNSIESVIVQSVALRLGMVAVGINVLTVPAEVKRQLAISEAKYIYTVPDLAAIVLEASVTDSSKVIVKDGFKGCTKFESLLEVNKSLPTLPSFEELSLLSNDPALIFISSGTMGPGKAVVLTQRNLQASFIAASHQWAGLISPKQLVYTPFSHISGFVLTMYGLARGYKSFLMTRFDFHTFLKTLQDHKIENLAVVPATAAMLAKSPDVSSYKLKSLKCLLNGTAPVSQEVENMLVKRFPGIVLRQVYGMTEMAGICSVVPFVNLKKVPPKLGSAGVPFCDVQMRVVDIETGASLGPGKQGEIYVKGDVATVGYKGDPKATADLKDKDEWIHTGDIGYYDDDGYFFIVDRLKDLIKFNAPEATYQISPSELEAVLLSHPDVADTGVVGLPDPTVGELPLAWIVRMPGSTVTEKDIDQFVTGKVPPYKKLRGGITFVKSIPRSATGKVLHRQIREEILRGRV